jgi:MerR family Zn(II)-responsive transcriptional regulator of zntA
MMPSVINTTKGRQSVKQNERQHESSSPTRANAVLTIGKVARLADVSIDTIRYYERHGLVSPVQKSDAGYRLYNDEAVRRLHFIKHAQHCGLSLAEIHQLLDLKRQDDACCEDVRSLVVQKKLQLEHKIKSLQTMSQALSELIAICVDDTKPLDACPILAALEASLKQGHCFSAKGEG